MSDILSESKADKQVIKNLQNEIARLKGLIMSHTEGKLLLDTNGDIYLSTQHTLVSETGVEDKVKQAKEQIAQFEEVKKTADRLQGGSDSTPAAPSTPVPAPSTPETPAAHPSTPQSDAVQTPSVPQPSTPSAPATPAPLQSAPIIVQ